MNKNIYKRPEKPLSVPVKKRASHQVDNAEINIMSVHRSTECHVTPPKIAARMAEYLNLDDGLRVLEPQAGTANLCVACFEQGFDIHLTAIELNNTLFNVTSNRLLKQNAAVINRCFLEYASHNRMPFDRIITNPPFSEVKKHINACLDLLAEDGEMVALVPVTFNHTRAEHLVSLDKDSFSLTSVSTKLIRFRSKV